MSKEYIVIGYMSRIGRQRLDRGRQCSILPTKDEWYCYPVYAEAPVPLTSSSPRVLHEEHDIRRFEGEGGLVPA